MSNHNISAIKHRVMEIISASQENNGYLEVDVKSYLCLVEDARAARIDYFLGHVDTKKRLLAIKQSTDLNVQRGGTYTEEQSTALYDPAVFDKKDKRDKVLEQGLVRTTRGRNGTTLVHIDVAIAHLIHICPEIEQFVIDTLKQFGRAMLAIQEGRTADAVIALDDIANAAVAAELESEGEVATAKRIKARQSGIKQRRAFTDLVEAMLGKDASPDEVGRVIGVLTNMTYQACFGVQAEDMREGLCCTNPRDAFSANAIRAMEYAEGALCAGFAEGRYKTMDDYKAHLMRLSPLLRMMANQLGDDPVVMENTNGPRVKVRPQGTFLGIMPAGASKVGFTAKQLTSEQD